MLRIKIATDNKVDVAGEDLEVIKKTQLISDEKIADLYNNINNSLKTNTQSLEVSLSEIRSFINSIVNDETVALRISDFLHKEKSVAQFRDLKHLSHNDYLHAFNHAGLFQDNEAKIKSIFAALS